MVVPIRSKRYLPLLIDPGWLIRTSFEHGADTSVSTRRLEYRVAIWCTFSSAAIPCNVCMVALLLLLLPGIYGRFDRVVFVSLHDCIILWQVQLRQQQLVHLAAGRVGPQQDFVLGVGLGIDLLGQPLARERGPFQVVRNNNVVQERSIFLPCKILFVYFLFLFGKVGVAATKGWR